MHRSCHPFKHFNARFKAYLVVQNQYNQQKSTFKWTQIDTLYSNNFLWACVFCVHKHDKVQVLNRHILSSHLVDSYIRAFTDPAIVRSICILPFTCVIVCGLVYVEANMCWFYLLFFLYIYLYWCQRSNYPEKRVVTLLTCVTTISCVPIHACPTTYLMYSTHISLLNFTVHLQKTVFFLKLRLPSPLNFWHYTLLT